MGGSSQHKDWGRVIQYDIDLGWQLKDPKYYGFQIHVDDNRTVAFKKCGLSIRVPLRPTEIAVVLRIR